MVLMVSRGEEDAKTVAPSVDFVGGAVPILHSSLGRIAGYVQAFGLKCRYGC